GYPAPEELSDEIPICEQVALPLKGKQELQELSAINWPVLAQSTAEMVRLLRPFDGSESDAPDKLGAYHRRTLDFALESWQRYRAI
ncbi:MAG: hypothetical protein M3Z35_08395, partial [Nitrospirota bacterium]|nr:hypothetical protein [Nitrospirota bacterium]